MKIFKVFYVLTVALAITVFNLSAFARTNDPVMKDGAVLIQYEDEFADKVNIAGSFNGWNKDANAMELGDDGIWFIEMKLKEGEHEYKFVIDGNSWIPSGDNLKVTVSKDKTGKLFIKKEKGFSIGGTDITFDGVYWTGMYGIKRRSFPSNQTRWRLNDDDPVQDIDFNITANYKDQVEAYAELNLNTERVTFQQQWATFGWSIGSFNTAYFVDEAHLKLKKPSYELKFFMNENTFLLNDYLHLDEQNDNDDRLYFADEKRPVEQKKEYYSEGKGIGRGQTGLTFNSNLLGLQTQFFAGRALSMKRDIILFRTAKKIKNFSIGTPILYSRDVNGVWGNPDGTGNTNLMLDDPDSGWVEYPRSSNTWYRYSLLRIIDPNRQNSTYRYGVDLSYQYKKLKIMGEVLKLNIQSPAVIYLRGDAGNAENVTPSGEQIFGEDFNGFTSYGGIKYPLTDNLKVEISNRFRAGKSNTVDGNGYLLNVNKKENRWYAGLRFENKKVYLGLEGIKTLRDNYPVQSRSFGLDDRGFYGMNIRNAGKEGVFYSILHWKPYPKVSIHHAFRYRKFNLLQQGVDRVWKDQQQRFQIDYKWTKRMTTTGEFRVAKYSTVTSRNFNNVYAGFEYKYAKDITVSLGYGYNFKYSLEKGRGRPMFLAGYFNTVASENNTTNATTNPPSMTLIEDFILEAEDRLENDRVINLEAVVKF